MNLPDDKKEKVKKIINNNSYTKQIFNLINIMLEKELTQEQMRKFAKLNLLILKRQSKLCIEEYKMYFSIKNNSQLNLMKIIQVMKIILDLL